MRRERNLPTAAWDAVKAFEQARVRYLKDDLGEPVRLVNACFEEFRHLVVAGLLTGARYSELARLRCEDFNAESKTGFVRISKSRRGTSP